MARKQLFILLGCMLIGGVLLTSMLLSSSIVDEKTIVRQPFIRSFAVGVKLDELKVVDLNVNSFYIAGFADKTVYLGNHTGPLHIVEVRLPEVDTVHHILQIDDSEIPSNFRYFKVRVDSPRFYLNHGVLPGIFTGQLKDLHAHKFLPVDCPYFVDAISIGPNEQALRSYSLETKAYELAKLTLDSPYFEFKPDLLEKQIDGLFCEEGSLHFSKSLEKLVYVYHFRNEYFVTDTHLHLEGRFHSIDTFRTAPLDVANVESKNYRTLKSKPIRFNAQSYVDDGLLFIQSPLLGKEDDFEKFNTTTTLDVYEIKDGQYLYSIQVPNYNNFQPSSFAIHCNFFVGIFGQHLIVYKMKLPMPAKNTPT